VVVEGKPGKAARDAVALGQQVGEAICAARDLVNEPPNELYPEALARVAAAVGKQRGLKVTVFDRAALTKRGMKLIMAVGQGSAREPRLVHMIYAPPGKPKGKLVFVGKGLTFDSGGLCIKPAPGMEEMKGDMGGAANVVALMTAVAALKPNVSSRTSRCTGSSALRRTCPTARRTGPETSSAPWTAGRWRSSTPTPRGASSSRTASPTRAR
jgi:leucyl aminopeptidase